MGSKLSGKFEASGRVGLRDRETGNIITVYPYKVEGTDTEVENAVKYWFYQRDCGAEERLENYYVDTLSPMELKNSQEKFLD